MTLQEIAAKLGIENYSEKLNSVYENLDQVCIDPCDPAFLEELDGKYDIFKEYAEEIKAAAAAIRKDPIRYPWTKTVATAIKTGVCQSGKEIPTPVSDETPAADWMPFLMLLPNIPDVDALYHKLLAYVS